MLYKYPYLIREREDTFWNRILFQIGSTYAHVYIRYYCRLHFTWISAEGVETCFVIVVEVHMVEEIRSSFMLFERISRVVSFCYPPLRPLFRVLLFMFLSRLPISELFYKYPYLIWEHGNTVWNRLLFQCMIKALTRTLQMWYAWRRYLEYFYVIKCILCLLSDR